MNEKKILLVSPEGLGNGGVQSIMMTIKQQLDKCQIDALLFTNEIRYYDKKFTELGGKIHRIETNNQKGIKKIKSKIIGWIIIYKSLNNLLKFNKYDIIHCNNEIESWICLLSAKKNKIPIRISHHHRSNYIQNRNILYKLYFKVIRRIILSTATTIICCSKKTKNDFYGKIERKKILVINNPVDLEKYTAKKIEHQNCELTNVGMYCKEKNQLFLVDVVNILKNKIKTVHLNLVGFGDEYQKKLETKIQKLKLENNITLIDGKIENSVLETLKKTDLFLFPSIQEGFGIVVIEAQAMNIKCLCSKNVPYETNVGLAEYIEIDNPKEWANRIIELLNDNNKKINKQLIDTFSIGNFINNIKNIYEI